MGGDVGVESRPGEGSKFYFELPLASWPLSVPKPESWPTPLRGARVLAVDDIEMNLVILTRQLERFGMDVTTCADPFDALAEVERAACRGQPYDIMIIDQMMPGLSGEALAGRIRSIPELTATKLVLSSSVGPTGRSPKANNILDAILDKPVRQRDLLACLARLHLGSEEREKPAPQKPEAEQSVPKSGGLKILLAEDNKINQQFALALLERAGHKVDVAENGLVAVDAVMRTDYDIVLMDVQMPQMDGLQATRQIRVLPAPKCRVPIIALTAHAMSGAREQYLDAGMDDYISKPIEPAILLELLNKIARERSGVQSAAIALRVP